MNGFGLKPLLTVSLASLLTGCYLEAIVPTGGRVESESGGHDCAERSFCSREITSADYSERYIAIASSGYTFVKWQEGQDFICGGSTNPICALSLGGGELAELVVASASKLHLMPIFRVNNLDTDGDGSADFFDLDDDNDGVPDELDVYPLDDTRSVAESGLATLLRVEEGVVEEINPTGLIQFNRAFYSIDGREGEFLEEDVTAAFIYSTGQTNTFEPPFQWGDTMYFTSFDCDGSSGTVYNGGGGQLGQTNAGGLITRGPMGVRWIINTPGEGLTVSNIGSILTPNETGSTCQNQFDLQIEYFVSHTAEVFIQ